MRASDDPGGGEASLRPIASRDKRHGIYPYPARLHPPLAERMFAQASELLDVNRPVVYDPFVGSGTVLLVAQPRARVLVGADSNPLARLITRCKLTQPRGREVRRLAGQIAIASKGCDAFATEVGNGWFTDVALDGLARLASAVRDYASGSEDGDVVRLALARTVHRLSLTDPGQSVPVHIDLDRLKPGSRAWKETSARLARASKADVVAEFIEQVDFLLTSLDEAPLRQPPLRLLDDARSRTRTAVPDLVITSPPYGPAQKYVRASQLELAFLGFPSRSDIAELQARSIGRERRLREPAAVKVHDRAARALLRRLDAHPQRSAVWHQYMVEIADALNNSANRLRPGGVFVLIAGTNVVRGETFDTSSYLVRVLNKAGLETVSQQTDPLRGWSTGTQRKGSSVALSHETVTLLRKGSGGGD